MVPSPPERSGRLNVSAFPLVQPSNTDLDITNVTPLLPQSFTIRLVVNGISGPERRYPEQEYELLWSNGGVDISCEYYGSPVNSFGLYNSAQITYESLDCYLDGVKMNLSLAQ